MRDLRALIGLLVLVFVIAAVGGRATVSSLDSWYALLAKPAWTPPGWVFGPVWTVLYVCMALAAWLVWRKRTSAAIGVPLACFGVQLALNALWTPLFFGLRLPGAALADILLLVPALAATLFSFWRVSPLAGSLLAPYFLWVSFAAVLNHAIWRLNR